MRPFPAFSKKDTTMLLMGDNRNKKKDAMSIVIAMGKHKPFQKRKEEGYNEEGMREVDTDKTEYTALAEEMMSAFKEESTEKLASILKAFASKFEQIGSDEMMGEEGEGEGEDVG